MVASKLVIVINGRASTGKDTVCNVVIDNYDAIKISAIDPIVNIALMTGWDGVKDTKSRKFLSDIKRAYIDFNDMPTQYLFGKYNEFINSEHDILFVHIRESDQIDAFVKGVTYCKCITLLIQNKTTELIGNYSDDNVENYLYDYYFVNDGQLENVGKDFLSFFEEMLQKENLNILPKRVDSL